MNSLDINISHGHQLTPLHQAVLTGQTVWVRMLLARGAKPNTPDPHGWHALHLAVECAHLPIVDLLLVNGADTRIPNPHGLFILDRAVAKGHVELVRMILVRTRNANILHCGWYLLHCAVAEGSLDIVRTLLYYGAKVNQLDYRNCSPLHIVAQRQMNSRNLWLVKLLLDHHANANIPDPQGVYPLHRAVAGGNTWLARTLLHHRADPNIADRGWYVLHRAVAAGNLDLVRALLAHGARINALDPRKCSPLHIDVHGRTNKKTLSLVETLLDDGADTSIPHPDGFAVLHRAVAQRNLLLVRLLLRHGAYANISDEDWPPLRRAINDGNLNFALTMLHAGQSF